MPALRPSSASPNRSGFGGLEVDHPTDKHGAANMRNDQPHAPAGFLRNHSVPLMAKNPDHCRAGRGFIEHGGHEVDQALRLGPLLVESGLENLVIRHDIGGGGQSFDLGEDVRVRGGVELDIFIEIEPDVMGIHSTVVIIDVAGFVHGIHHEKRRRRPLDEFSGSAEHAAPQ
jgi:hypothetical protein